MADRYDLGPNRSQGLVEVLDRVLDKGLMIAGDIRIKLADVELLTIQIRLLVCSLDKAQEIGMDWWKTDPRLSTYAQERAEGRAELAQTDLSEKLAELSRRLQTLEDHQLRD